MIQVDRDELTYIDHLDASKGFNLSIPDHGLLIFISVTKPGKYSLTIEPSNDNGYVFKGEGYPKLIFI